MIEDSLKKGLMNIGYQRIDSNIQGIYMFYRVEDNKLSIISVIYAINGNEIEKDQYEHILEQIKSNYNKAYSRDIKLVSLLVTQHPDRLKPFCMEAKSDIHWIIDLQNYRLLIYENQSSEDTGLSDLIENILIEERMLREEERQAFGGGHQGQQIKDRVTSAGRRQRLKVFTLMNTLIIIINVIVYLIQHYLPLFGGEQQILVKGALSWYYVTEKKEFYRVITSMFMHSDWSHLFNNMLVLLFIGDNLERAAGRFRYLLIYFGTGILAGMTSIGYNLWKDGGQYSVGSSVFSIGASGAIFGIVGAVLYIVIVNRGRLEDISTRQMVFFVVLSLYSGIINAHIDQAAHVGGFIAGIVLAAILYHRPKPKIQLETNERM